MLVFFIIMAKSSDYLKQYQSFTTNRVRPEDYVKRYQTELGVDAVRDRVGGARAAIRSTEDVIRNAPAGVAGRTSGSLVTDAQRNALVQQEVAPLRETLQTQSSAFGDAQSELQDLLGQAGQRAEFAYGADTERSSNLMELYRAAQANEQAAAEQRRWEKQMAEQRRQFDAEMRARAADRAAASRAAAASIPSPSFGGGGGGGGGRGSALKQTAVADVGQLFTRMGTSSFVREIQAIYKSAGYGNAYDKAKLELIRAKQPGLFSGNKLNNKRVNQLINMYSAMGR